MREGVGFYELVLELTHSYYDIAMLYVAEGGDYHYQQRYLSQCKR